MSPCFFREIWVDQSVRQHMVPPFLPTSMEGASVFIRLLQGAPITPTVQPRKSPDRLEFLAGDLLTSYCSLLLAHGMNAISRVCCCAARARIFGERICKYFLVSPRWRYKSRLGKPGPVVRGRFFAAASSSRCHIDFGPYFW